MTCDSDRLLTIRHVRTLAPLTRQGTSDAAVFIQEESDSVGNQVGSDRLDGGGYRLGTEPKLGCSFDGRFPVEPTSDGANARPSPSRALSFSSFLRRSSLESTVWSLPASDAGVYVGPTGMN